ncbi:Rossmann-like domain-containing protein [Streptomyces sp. NPDC088812]|uniref:Rossmann-like domain-containing protein n=1 Tax=Streptomyces sp. NPDC088812 TaxID=3365905 RepID=UPI0038080E2F
MTAVRTPAHPSHDDPAHDGQAHPSHDDPAHDGQAHPSHDDPAHLSHDGPAHPSHDGPAHLSHLSHLSYDDLVDRVRSGALGPDPATRRIAVAFTTRQAVRHDGRGTGYRNEVLSLRLAEAVGSCAVEPGELPDSVLDDCVGTDVRRLLDHPQPAVRVAALDAYLMHVTPHGPGSGARPLALPAGTSLEKSRARAEAVVALLDLPAGSTVLVVGVVNSLLAGLRARGLRYVPCDLKGGVTEWDEPVVTDALTAAARCDALLVSGMTLGNGTFEPLRRHALAHGKQLVTFAQTGSAVLPRFLGHGVSAVCAEPYPFFWLDGGPGTVHRYRSTGGGR